MRKLYTTFRNTHHAPEDDTFATATPCTCTPHWPSLETAANGYLVRALPSSHNSILTNPEVGTFVARCTACSARFPEPWVIDTGDQMPYAWARGTD
ncbi:hypothetical protein [Streptomyces sp. NPDC060194]|uniref:hypothetical protein n=1 Tax=Streptomyces sp. NPDC060194 TaxID=3347069 RepID=UPI00365897BC